MGGPRATAVAQGLARAGVKTYTGDAGTAGLGGWVKRPAVGRAVLSPLKRGMQRY